MRTIQGSIPSGRRERQGDVRGGAKVTVLHPSLGARLRRELQQHRMAYIVLGLFMIGGILIIPEIFPEATRLQGAVGGIFLGVWAALCAVPQKFIDE